MSEAFWLVDQLVQQGVHYFCLAPGSRSTPLVLAVAEHRNAKVHVHYDERGLGFFALGLAKAKGKPAAVIVTSGTAVGNLLPSVMEAHHSCTPLILLTADRPPELKDCSANQTTDQVKVFQPFVRWQADLPCTVNESYFRSIAAQAYFYARQNQPGPVHINCSFRDPLFKEVVAAEGSPIHMQFPKRIVKPQKCHKSKGLILIGRLPCPEEVLSVLKLAERLHWPVCADILSNARCYPTVEQIKYFDWMNKPTPELILHFGERMTSKRMLEWLKEIKTEYIHVSPWTFLQDPARILTGRVQADIPEYCKMFEAEIDPTWLGAWEDCEPVFEEKGVFTEVHAMRALCELLPAEFGVFLGNGMPIRDADHFLFPKEGCSAFFGNRGLSGIDGNIATIAGLAEEMPILGIIGDQASLHDLNSLPLLKKTKHPVVLLISNNFGGGIFHHLPVSQSPHFEQLWALNHDLHFEMAAKMYEIPYFPFEQLEEVFQLKQSAIVELVTSRTANFEYQKSFRKNIIASHG